MATPLDISQPIVNPARLQLGSGNPRTLLDGGWWPRSKDPDTELPALIMAIDHLYSPIRRMVLSAGGWESHPRHIRIDARTIRLGYFASQPVALLTALCDDGQRVDLLVVPPDTAPQTAVAAMAVAASTTNAVHAQHITANAAEAGSSPAALAAAQAWGTDMEDPHAIRPRTLQPDDHRLPHVAGHGLTAPPAMPMLGPLRL